MPKDAIPARKDGGETPGNWIYDASEDERIMYFIRLAEVYMEAERDKAGSGRPLDTTSLDAQILLPEETLWKAKSAGMVEVDSTMVSQLRELAMPPVAPRLQRSLI